MQQQYFNNKKNPKNKGFRKLGKKDVWFDSLFTQKGQ